MTVEERPPIPSFLDGIPFEFVDSSQFECPIGAFTLIVKYCIDGVSAHWWASIKHPTKGKFALVHARGDSPEEALQALDSKTLGFTIELRENYRKTLQAWDSRFPATLGSYSSRTHTSS